MKKALVFGYMVKVFLKWFIGLLVIPAAVIGSLYSLNEAGYFNLQTVDISFSKNSEHVHFLAPLKVELQELIEAQKGKSLWKLNLQLIADSIRKKKWVLNLQITRRWPGTLAVMIVPQDIKLLYSSRAGKLLPVVSDGSLLDPVSLENSPDVTLLEGEHFEHNLELRKKAVQMIDEIPTEGKFSPKRISEIRHDSKDGFWMTMMKTGLRVKMGEDNFALKASRVGQVIEYMENRQLEARVIDANLSKKVLVRLRKDP